MTLSFMIKKKYLAEKIAEQEQSGTFHERREYKRFWRKRIGSVHEWGNFFTHAVFLCGRHSFQADVLNISIEETPDKYVSVAGTTCYNIECKFKKDEIDELCVFLSSP